MQRYLSNIYTGVFTALVGMVITFRQLLKPTVTHQYPYEHNFEKKNIREIAHGFRGQLHNRVEDCIVCQKCAQICPVDCIYIDSTKPKDRGKMWESMNVVHLKDRRQVIGIIEADIKKIAPNTKIKVTNTVPEGKTREINSDEIDRIVPRKKVALFMDRFDIDMSLCMYCGLCTEVCPTECLTMVDTLKGSEYSEFNREFLIYQFAKPEMYK